MIVQHADHIGVTIKLLDIEADLIASTLDECALGQRESEATVILRALSGAFSGAAVAGRAAFNERAARDELEQHRKAVEIARSNGHLDGVIPRPI